MQQAKVKKVMMASRKGVSRSASILSAISGDDMELEDGRFSLRPSSYLKIGDIVSLFGESDTGVRGFVSTLGYVAENV